MRRKLTIICTMLISIILIIASGGGGGNETGVGNQLPQSLSMFDLTEEHFQEHNEYSLDNTGMHPESFTRNTFQNENRAPATRGWTDTGISVEKGDILFLSASGIITLNQEEYGPNGSPFIGGPCYPLTNRPVNGLFGRIASSEFMIGESMVLLAPASGTIEATINICDNDIIQGGFDLEIHTLLLDHITIANEPSLYDNSVLETAHVSVPCKTGWIKSGLTVEKGTKLFFDATGEITVGEYDPTVYGPDGSDSLGGGDHILLPNRRAYRLHGKIGSQVFQLGVSGAVLAPSNGDLELAINDFTDIQISGQFEVTIGRGVKPASTLPLPTGDVGEALDGPVDLVSSEYVWNSSHLTVERGIPISFAASGQIKDFQGVFICGPGGESSLTGDSYFLTNYFANALYGKIGTQVFFIGESNVIIAPATGNIELVINNSLDCKALSEECNSYGSFGVAISKLSD